MKNIFTLATEADETDLMNTEQSIEETPATDPEQEEVEIVKPDMDNLHVDEVAEETAAKNKEDQLAELEDYDAALEECTNTLHTYSKFVNLIDVKTGLNQLAFESIQICVTDMNQRLGLGHHFKDISTESNSTDRSVSNAKIALEGIMQTVKDIITRIVAMIKRAIDWVKEYFHHFTDEARKLKEKFITLRDVALKLSTAPAKANASKIDMNDFKEVLRHKNTVIYEDHIVQFVDAYCKKIDSVFSDTVGRKKQDSILKCAEDYIAASKGSVHSNENNEKQVNALHSFLAELPAFTNKQVVNGVLITYLDLEAGDKCIQAKSNAKVNLDSSGKANLHYELTIENNPDYKVIKDPKPNKPLTALEVKAVCDKMVDHLGQYEIMESSFQYKKLLDQIQGKIKGEDMFVEEAVILSFIVKQVLKVFSKLANELKAYDMTVSRTVYKYCHKSMTLQ